MEEYKLPDGKIIRVSPCQFVSSNDADFAFSWDRNDIERLSCSSRQSWSDWSIQVCIRWWSIRSIERTWICGRVFSEMSF